ncbi:g1442 [Coccomyxa elongata]
MNSSVMSQVASDQVNVLDPLFWRRLNLDDTLRQQLSELPGTKNLSDLSERASSLADIRSRMRKGLLPSPSADWPAEPFRSGFLAALNKMEMPRFTRRYPQLLDPLLKQMLTLVHEFEAKLEEIEQQQQQQQNQQQSQDSMQQQQQSSDQGQDQDSQSGADGEPNWEDMSQEQLEEMMQQGGSSGQEGQELQISLEQKEGGSAGESGEQEEEGKESMEEAIQKAADELVEKFEEEWKPAMENLQEADAAFDNLEDLMEGPVGYDLSHALWKSDGWREMKELRKKLENLKELRDLVRKLGRASGKGPKRRAPEEIEARSRRRGVIRSSLQPEETAGLTRSGDLSRMLPFEAHLLAAGWPRSDGPDGEQQEGSRAARLLHMVRRAERGLMSYDRQGWLDDEPCRPTGRLEIRPAAELGPIIVCLDTSGSMAGARETVAKAVALECMRGAHRQQRACYLYAFSGPRDVKELELKVDAPSLLELLAFLQYSFGGGTDVDRPLELSLDRLEQKDWAQADIMMVTDGEIAPPSEAVLQRLERARSELGLEVHGLLVGRSDSSPAMETICTHTHVFQSWNAVGGSRYD